jgi:hypothetical protein
MFISFLILYRNKRKKTVADWNAINDKQDVSAKKVSRSTYKNVYQY